jgi:hypothetical protein
VTDLAHRARLVLHEWARRPDPDPDQQRWKTLYLEAMIEAAGRTGLLETDELARWRTVTDHDSWPSPAADPLRVDAHLEALFAQLTRLRREPDPQALAAGARFRNALTTLHRSGAISDEDHAGWHARALHVHAPWLDDGDLRTIAGMSGAVAIAIPPNTEEEALQDAAALARPEPPTDTTLVRVHPARSIERHGGTAITALVLRSGCFDVHFHHVGGPHGDTAVRDHPAAFRAALENVPPPAVSDDRGTPYEPVSVGPKSAQGVGGGPDPQRLLVITGAWRYQPAVPLEAASLTFAARGRQTQIDLSV